MDAIIDTCSTTLKHLYITLNNFKMAFQRPAFPAPLALESVRTRPRVENIHIDVAEFNAQDLQYIMHKFPGATKVIIETSGYEDGEAVNRMLADGLLSPQIYLDAFKWLISLKSFEVVRLTLIANVREMLAFWAKRPQIKAITISGNAFVSREGATFSIMNTEGEAEMNDTLFEYREKGVWEMWVDLCYIDGFTSIYEQTLEQFKCDSVEHISLYPQLDNHIPLDPLEIEQSEAIGKGFSYVLDHYTAVKEMIIRHARIESFHATTTVHNKAMKRLKFQYCWIEPIVLPQLSCCVSYIERLEFRSVTFLNDDPDEDEDDGVVVIDMPQTSIDEITVHYDIDKEFLVNVYRSHPSISNQATVHYYIIDESKAGEIEQDLYRDLATSEEFRSSHNILEVHCADLKNFIVSTNIIKLNIQID